MVESIGGSVTTPTVHGSKLKILPLNYKHHPTPIHTRNALITMKKIITHKAPVSPGQFGNNPRAAILISQEPSSTTWASRYHLK
jgi:hypothetical protein